MTLTKLALLALLAQYLILRLAATAAHARNRRRKLTSSATLIARLELRGPSFEILVLAFFGYLASWPFEVYGTLAAGLNYDIPGLLLATIVIGRAISWAWPLARIRRLGHFLSFAPILALVAIGAAGLVLMHSQGFEEASGNIESPPALRQSGAADLSPMPATEPAKADRSAAVAAAAVAAAAVVEGSSVLPSRVDITPSSIPSDLDDQRALSLICEVFPVAECHPDTGTVSVRLEKALAVVDGYVELREPSAIRVSAYRLLLSLADSGNTASQHHAANYFRRKNDLNMALSLYDKASRKGYGEATYELSRFKVFSGGEGMDDTVQLLELAITQGYDNPPSRLALAKSLLRRGKAKDCLRIGELLRSAGDTDTDMSQAGASDQFSKLCGAK